MASKRGRRRRACVGKRKYATAKEALRDVADMRRKQRRSDIDAYHCRHCGGIHIGHTPRRYEPWPAIKRGDKA